MSFTEVQVAALSGPLDKSKVRERSQAGRQLSYIEAWWAIAEANRIFGYAAWDRETVEMTRLGDPREVDGKWRVGYSSKVRIRVTTPDGEVITREGTGFGSGIDRDPDQACESAIKEAESDAMKRALMTFGNPFGLALYDKSQSNVVDLDAGRKSAAQAKRDGDNETIKAELAQCTDLEMLGVWVAMRLPHWLAICPRTWEDPINDFYLNRREELLSAQQESAA